MQDPDISVITPLHTELQFISSLCFTLPIITELIKLTAVHPSGVVISHYIIRTNHVVSRTARKLDRSLVMKEQNFKLTGYFWVIVVFI